MLQKNLKRIRDTLTAISPNVNVYHYQRPQMKAPYIVWAEDGEEDSFEANNHKAEQTLYGTLDFYTKTEYDPVADAIQEALNALDNLSWRYDSTDYEDETGLIHHSWEWRYLCGIS